MSSEVPSADDHPLPQYQEINGFRMPTRFSREAFLSALAYKPRPDDLFIVTFPKCGTTWVQYIVGGIYRGGRPYDSRLDFMSNTPFLEFTGVEGVEKMKRPGAIKCHLPFHLAPYSPLSKYIFLARNPKDTCVSLYHHTKNSDGYKFQDGKFDDFFDIFIEGKTAFGDYFETLLSWYEHRDDPNVLFLTYEELKKDIEKNVLRIAEFMGAEYQEAMKSDLDLLSNVIKQSSFNYMKDIWKKHLEEMRAIPKEVIENNPHISETVKKVLTAENKPFPTYKAQFIRKGIVGDWKNYFSEEQSARLDAKFREKTKNTDIPKLWEDCM